MTIEEVIEKIERPREINIDTPHSIEACVHRLRSLQPAPGTYPQVSWTPAAVHEVTIFQRSDHTCDYTILARQRGSRRRTSYYTTATAMGNLIHDPQTSTTKVTGEVKIDLHSFTTTFIMLAVILVIVMFTSLSRMFLVVVVVGLFYLFYIRWNDQNKLVQRIQEVLQ